MISLNKTITKMKRFFLLFFIIISCSSNSESFVLKSVTVKDFKEFINDSDYITDAERYGWSIVQTDVYNYHVVEGCRSTPKIMYDDNPVEAKLVAKDKYLDLALLKTNLIF